MVTVHKQIAFLTYPVFEQASDYWEQCAGLAGYQQHAPSQPEPQSSKQAFRSFTRLEVAPQPLVYSIAFRAVLFFHFRSL